MLSSISFIYLSALVASVVESSPTPTQPLEKRSFVHHVKRQTTAGRPMAGAAAMAQAYHKWGFPEPKAWPKFNVKAATGTGVAPAVPEPNAAEYLSPVKIGGQTLILDFDTGSSDLWVFSTALTKDAIGGHAAYDPTKSKTFKMLNGATWSISYGDGSGAAGIVGYDTVDVGGATATQQAVEMATAISSSFVRDVNNDGLLGLAFSQLNTVKPTKQKTFFDSVMPQLAQPLFSVDLRNDSTGTYTFGAIDAKYESKLVTVPVNAASGFWQTTSSFFVVGNQKVANQGASPAIADTGTSLLLVDAQVAQAYYSQVRGASNSATVGGWVYPCSSTLPDFGVALGSYTAMIPGSGITFAQVDSTTCFGAIQSNGGANLQIYGDVLFRAQYVVFDGQKKALRITPKF